MNFELLIMLWAGHCLADFGLQTQMMAEKKKRIFIEPIGFHALTAHAAIHGLVIGFIAQSFMAGVIVGVLHWAIDLRAADIVKMSLKRKTELFGIHADQLLHFLVILAVAWRLS